MKLFGHPVHLMLVHFPSALLPMDVVCSAIGRYSGDSVYTGAAFMALTGGVVFGWLSIVFGAADLLNVREKRPEALVPALVHGGINTVVILGYSVLAVLKYRQYPDLMPDEMWLLMVKVVLLIVMIVGNHMGGRLILRYKVAVNE